MMENREYLNSLFDIYKELLTDVEKNTFIDYYIEDLSLSEIADIRNISKSSVGKTLKNVELKLNNYESILNIYDIKKELEGILELSEMKKIKEKIEMILANK